MKYPLRLALALLMACTPLATHATNPLPRSAPEEQGVSSTALLEFINTLDQQVEGMHSVMVVRHGQAIAEGWWSPYDATHNQVLYSLSKSFTSTAVGFAVAEGRLSLDDEVLKFFPADAPTNVSSNLKAMRVRDLLIMSTGHQDEPTTSPESISAKSFLAQPVPHLPGTHFKYNTAATFMQSAIVNHVTGQSVLDYLQPRLFEPLGIEHPVWDTNFQGISLGGYGLRVHTEDIAKFGQLYLQKGSWQGKQLLTADWVALATSKQTSNGSNPKSDWNQGYGFQFWRCRHNAFRGDGAFGQFCVVIPEQESVVAITSGIKDLQAALNAIWDKLLPILQLQPLPPNPAADQKLKEKLAHLVVRPAAGSPSSPIAATVMSRKYVFPENEQKLETLSLRTNADKTLVLSARLNNKEVTVPCGYQAWQRGHAPLLAGRLAQFTDEPTAGTFAWPADDTCVLKLCAFETPYHTTYTLKFDCDQVALDTETNVAFGATKRPQLIGRAE